MTLSCSIRNLSPSRLWLVRLAVRLAGATIRVWRAKPRRVAPPADERRGG